MRRLLRGPGSAGDEARALIDRPDRRGTQANTTKGPATRRALRASIVSDGGARLAQALETWAGIENFEERLVPAKLDPVVLAQLRTQSDY